MSYKSDAIDLIANAIDKETRQQTPAGDQLEISEEDVKKVQEQVKMDDVPNDHDASDLEQPTTPPDLDSSCGE